MSDHPYVVEISFPVRIYASCIQEAVDIAKDWAADNIKDDMEAGDIHYAAVNERDYVPEKERLAMVDWDKAPEGLANLEKKIFRE